MRRVLAKIKRCGNGATGTVTMAVTINGNGRVAKATAVADVRRALLEARAAEDEATAIQGQVRTAVIEPPPPAIDTAAIYAARNQNAH